MLVTLGTRILVRGALIAVLLCGIDGRADDAAAVGIDSNWTWVETPFGKPVIDRGAAGNWDHAAVDNPYVYVEDGRYYCFFEAQDTKRAGWHERIGLAVSTDGVKWSKCADNPMLDVGPAGAWDGAVTKLPSGIIKRDGTCYLFYSGRNHADIRKTTKGIGVATAHKLTGPWRKHAGNPVLSGRHDAWDRHVTTMPTRLLQRGGSYWILYRGMKGFYHDQGLGAATSDDLLNWNRVPPVRQQPLIPVDQEVASIAIAHAGGRYVGISQPLKLADRRYWYSSNLVTWKKGPAVKFKASVQAETLSNPFLVDGRWNVLYEQGDRIYRAVLTSPSSPRHSSGPWRVQTGMTWHTVGHAGETGYLGIQHRNLPGQKLIVRAPEYANLYKSLLLIPARWQWLDDATLKMNWDAPRKIQDQHQVARTAVFRFGEDFVDIVATVRNCSGRDWGSVRYDMFDVMTREASMFRDDSTGERTFVYRKDRFQAVGSFPIKDLHKRLVGSLSLATNRKQSGELEFTERLMVEVSEDGQWVLGIASDNATGISFNLDPGTGCIHQNPHWGRLKAGEEKQTHVRVYLIKGSLPDLWKRYLTDFSATASPSNEEANKPTTPSCPLQQLWRTRLGVNSPTNVIVGRRAKRVYLCVQGSDARHGRGGTVEALSAKGRPLWQSSAGPGRGIGAYIQWIDVGPDEEPLVASSFTVTRDAKQPGGLRFVRARDGVLVKEIENTTHFGNNNSIVADLDGDGRPEFVYADQSTLTCYNLPGFHLRWRFDKGVRFCWSLPALADTNRDGRPEIVFGSEYNTGKSNSSMLAIDDNGKQVWRSDGHAEDLGSTPAFVADVDGDGKNELLKVDRNECLPSHSIASGFSPTMIVPSPE